MNSWFGLGFGGAGVCAGYVRTLSVSWVMIASGEAPALRAARVARPLASLKSARPRWAGATKPWPRSLANCTASAKACWAI